MALSLTNATALGLHLTAGASDGYIMTSDNVYSGATHGSVTGWLEYLDGLVVDDHTTAIAALENGLEDLEALVAGLTGDDIDYDTVLTVTGKIDDIVSDLEDLQTTVDNLGDISDSETVTYTAGDGIDISNYVISWDPSSVDTDEMLSALRYRNYIDYATYYYDGTTSIGKALKLGDITWQLNSLKLVDGDESGYDYYGTQNYTSIIVPYAGVEDNNFGVVAAGDGITITDGIVSVDTDCFYCDNYFSTGLNLATVYLGGTGEDYINTIYVPYATTSQYGVIKVGTGLDVSSGVLSVDASDVVSASAIFDGGTEIGSITIDSTTTTFFVEGILSYDDFEKGFDSVLDEQVYIGNSEAAQALGELLAGLIKIADSNWDNLSASQQSSIEETWSPSELGRFLGMLEILFQNSFA